MRKAVAAASYEEAAQNLLALATKWTPDAQGALISDALELAAYEGREAVFLDEEAAPAFAATAEGLTFREQIDFLTQKRPRPTTSWLDALRGDHDRSFVVAGVKDVAMLEEFQQALVRAIPSQSIDMFAKDFDRLVEKYGWDYQGERAWRIRTIFQTNLRTSFMAGRLRQMRDPDVVKVRPYWQYVHGDSRIPATPRKVHVSWDKLVLRWDDPWWDTHFPPNDWLCSCGVRSLSRGDLRRMGKDGPDQAPQDAALPVIDPATGQLVMQPTGIGYGWDYMPGDRWDRGLVPSGLIGDPDNIGATGRSLVNIDTPTPIAEVLQLAKPFTATLLSEGLPPEDYVTAFLARFGAEIGKPLLWTDAAGTRIIISDDLFRANSGEWKVTKRGRDIYAAMIAEAIADPDEIWLGVRTRRLDDQPGYEDQVVTRRYVRFDRDTGTFAAFELGRRFWEAVTGFAPRNRSKPDWSYLDRQRLGRLIWRRK
jgi:hypothetical protein